MSSSGSTLILYYIQGELGESLEYPNAFYINQSNKPISYKDFLSNLPITDKSDYHYRFRLEDKLLGYSWIDLIDPDDNLPVFNGYITAKLLKLNALVCVRRSTRLKLKNLDNMKALVLNNPVPSFQSTQSSQPTTNLPVYRDNPSNNTNTTTIPSPRIPYRDNVDVNDNVSPIFTPKTLNPSTTADVKSIKASSGSIKKLQPPPITKPSPVDRQESLIDDSDIFTAPSTTNAYNFFDTNIPVNTSTKSNNTNDIDIDESSNSKSIPSNLSRSELAARREANIQEKVKEALEFKLELDDKNKKECEELEVAKAKFDKDLHTWTYNFKEKRNIRTLLSTMHTVLWPGNTWKPISLGDLLESKQVKLQYRKAMLIVHPDRCSNQSVEVKFIAKRVFEAINEAYQDFLKKEGGV